MISTLALLLSACTPHTAPAATPHDLAQNPVELGNVRFSDDLDRALDLSRSSGKPLFLLFQEIPGCATCRSFGDGPLSHPLLVEAIETEFVPVVVHNNRGGKDAETLARFGEPAWNNPVVRFLDAGGKDLLSRVEGAWTSGAIAERMLGALRAAQREVPAWLELVALEESRGPTGRAIFAMPCYWTGQARLGALDGVVSVAPGFVGGAEVTEVVFRPRRLAYAELVGAADRASCAELVFTLDAEQARVARGLVGDRARTLEREVRPAHADERLYHLQRSPLRWLPLTEAQAVRANADVASGRDPSRWLSSRQKAVARRIAEVGPAALEGLVRPQANADLARYARSLAERLAEPPGPSRR